MARSGCSLPSAIMGIAQIELEGLQHWSWACVGPLLSGAAVVSFGASFSFQAVAASSLLADCSSDIASSCLFKRIGRMRRPTRRSR